MSLVDWSAFLEKALQRPPLIRCRGKVPVDAQWTTGPWDDPDRWRSLLEGWTDNVGMLTGKGMAVLDVDLYRPQAEASLDALLEDTALSLETVTVITPRGGRHYYYRYDPALRVPSRSLEPDGYPGVDIKADGGFVVVPSGP